MKRNSVLVLVVLLVLAFSIVVMAGDVQEDIMALEGFEAPVEVAEEDQIADFAEAFRGDQEQGPVWYYFSHDSTGINELYYTPDWGDNWQYSENPDADNVYYSLFDWEGLKASAGFWADEVVKTIIAWQAYDDGTAVIGEWDYTALDGNAELDGTVDGAVVEIIKADKVVTRFHNTELIFSAVTSGDDNLFEGTEVEVKKGDMIFFVFDGKNAPGANIKIEGITVELQ